MDTKVRTFYSTNGDWTRANEWLGANADLIDVVSILYGQYDKTTERQEIYYKEKKCQK